MGILYTNNTKKEIVVCHYRNNTVKNPPYLRYVYKGSEFVWDLCRKTMIGGGMWYSRREGFIFVSIKGYRFTQNVRNSFTNIKGRACRGYQPTINETVYNTYTMFESGVDPFNFYYEPNMSGKFDRSGGAASFNGFNLSEVPYAEWKFVDNSWKMVYNTYTYEQYKHMWTYVTDMSRCFDSQGSLFGEPICGDAVIDMRDAYYECGNLTGNPVCGLNVVNMRGAYYGCRNLTGNPVCGSNVMDFSQTYKFCNGLQGDGVCGDNVTNMCNTYRYCEGLTGNLYCGDSVVNFRYAYYGCENATGNARIGLSVTDGYQCFKDCRKISRGVVWGGTNLANAFEHCNNMSLATIDALDLSNAQGMFIRCTNLKRCDLYAPNLKNAALMFMGCYNLSTISDIPQNIQNARLMFNNCRNLHYVSSIPDSIVTGESMFENCENLSISVTSLPSSLKDGQRMFSHTNISYVSISIPEGVKVLSMFSGALKRAGGDIYFPTVLENEASDIGIDGRDESSPALHLHAAYNSGYFNKCCRQFVKYNNESQSWSKFNERRNIYVN